MSKLFSWVRSAIRALLIFIVATSAIGVSCWMVERYSLRDIVGVAMVGLGWFAIGYSTCNRGRPHTRGEQ
jgi:hypothetical protein